MQQLQRESSDSTLEAAISSGNRMNLPTAIVEGMI
jgi:hypothetical protein